MSNALKCRGENNWDFDFETHLMAENNVSAFDLKGIRN